MTVRFLWDRAESSSSVGLIDEGNWTKRLNLLDLNDGYLGLDTDLFS